MHLYNRSITIYIRFFTMYPEHPVTFAQFFYISPVMTSIPESYISIYAIWLWVWLYGARIRLIPLDTPFRCVLSICYTTRKKKFISTSLLFNSRFILKSEQLTHNFYICSMLLVSNTVSLAEKRYIYAMRCFHRHKGTFSVECTFKEWHNFR